MNPNVEVKVNVIIAVGYSVNSKNNTI
jgi:hypothetical protein